MQKAASSCLLFSLLFFVSVFFVRAASAAGPDGDEKMDQASTTGKSGWEMNYGYQEDLDGPSQNAEKKDSEEKKVRLPEDDDFFGETAESYDKVLSEEHLHPKKQYEPVILP